MKNKIRTFGIALFAIWFSLFYGCKKDNPADKLSIGQNYAGGIIFYLDSTKVHGLVCASIDQSSGIIWSSSTNTIINARGTDIGTGQSNTYAIVSAQGNSYSYAARLCDDLVLNGYSDWYLPSLVEIYLMNSNLKMDKNIGYFSKDAYWSSTESGQYNAWVQYFGTPDLATESKVNQHKVRAIRAF